MRGSGIKSAIVSLAVLITISLMVLKPSKSEAEIKRFNMSYIFFGNSDTYSNYVEKTNGALDVISPSYFNLNEDGSLQITSTMDSSFIKKMHRENIRVVPFLSNHWDREVGRAALANRKELAEQIVEVIEKYDLDGINIDIENVTQDDRDNYTDFVKIISEQLPESKEISVAVAANPKGYKVGWHGSYDYSKLADYADYLILMAYDESYYGSPSGPVAGHTFVENSIKYALERVSPDKIVLGIPFYGRYWNDDENVGGNGVSLVSIDSLINRFNGTVHYDKEAESPMVRFTVPQNDNKFYIAGKELTPGNYTLWYENEESIKSKLELVQKYNLKGTGSWSLGQETPETWDYYSLWLNSKYFIDIHEHWAKDDIVFVSDKGWMKGTASTEFSPEMKLTRAQAAVTLVRAMNLEGQAISNDKLFADVTKKHWAYNEIQIAKEFGIFTGMEKNKFNPDSFITREQMTTLVSRIIDYNATNIDIKKEYSDVDKNRWSYKAISEMSSLGIFEGYDDGMFMPTESLTRAQMAAVMSRISGILNN